MWKTNVIGVNRRPRIATAPVERSLADICAATPKTRATTTTVIPLSWARRKMAAPRREKELSDNPVRMKNITRIPAEVLGKRPIFARMAMTIQPGKYTFHTESVKVMSGADYVLL